MKTILVALCALLAISQLACSTSPESKDKLPSERQLVVQRTLLQRHARWIPSDTLGVGVVDLRPITENAFSKAHWGSNPQVVANQENLRRELGEMMTKRLGMDLTGLQYMVIGGGPTWQSVIVGGIKLSMKQLKTEQVNGFEVFTIQSNHPADQEIIEEIKKEASPWAVKVGDDALAFFANRRAMELAVNTPSVTLSADEARAKRFDEMLGGEGSYASTAVLFDNPLIAGALTQAKLPFEAPDAISMAVGEQTRLTLYGPKGKLEKIDAELQKFLSEYESKIKAEYETREEKNTLEAMSVVYGYHTALTTRELLKPQLTDKSLTYKIQTPSLSSPVMFVGIAAAIAVPAFLRFSKESKANETSWMMSKIEQQVYRYQETNQAPDQTKCALPPSTGPSSALPVGGKTIKPAPKGEGWEKLGAQEIFADGTYYFSYEVISGEDEVTIVAKADFKEGGEVHTVTQKLRVNMDESGCYLESTPSVTTHELE